MYRRYTGSYQITKMCFICIAICDNNYICHCNITFGLGVYMWLFSLSADLIGIQEQTRLFQ